MITYLQFAIFICFLLQTICQQPNHFFYNKIHTIKVEGNTTLMYYYINIYVGTPPQRQTVIIDTGSHLTAFPCSDCQKKCGKHIDQQFNFEGSLTSSYFGCKDQQGQYICDNCNRATDRCQWQISYAEGSRLGGYMARDYVVIGDEIQKFLEKDGVTQGDQSESVLKFLNHEKVYFVFGCTQQETNLFLTQAADGIMGLAPNTNGKGKPPNIVDEVFRQHSGGFMSIGGYNDHLHRQNEQTHIVNYHDEDGFYGINIKNIMLEVAGIDIGLKQQDISRPFIDSGTTLFFGPSSILNPMYNKILNQCQQPNMCQGVKKEFRQSGFTQHCWFHDPSKFTDIQDFYNTFPNITFQMDTFEYVWLPENYFFIDPQYEKSYPNLYCFGFEPYHASRIYLGGSWMRQYDILFDRENKQLHFTKSDCSGEQVDQGYIEREDKEIEETQDDINYIDRVKGGKKLNQTAQDDVDAVLLQNDTKKINQSENNSSNVSRSRSDTYVQQSSQDSEQILDLITKQSTQKNYDVNQDQKKYTSQVTYLVVAILFGVPMLAFMIFQYCKRRNRLKNLIDFKEQKLKLQHNNQQDQPEEEKFSNERDKSQIQDTYNYDDKLEPEEDSEFGYQNNDIEQQHEEEEYEDQDKDSEYIRKQAFED